jgi:D-alanyl-D-alanine carboxypeptidase (penicillin-binding protein 5/6)
MPSCWSFRTIVGVNDHPHPAARGRRSRRISLPVSLAIGIAAAGLGAALLLDYADAEPTASTDGEIVASDLTAEPVDHPLPAVDAAAYAVFDADAGRMLAERNGAVPVAVGSIMKLLTAKVAMDAGEQDRIVTVPALDHGKGESLIGLFPGERLPRDVLLRAMLIVSANDAARALAVDIAGSESAFVGRMNDAAAGLQLDETHAVNSTGLDAPDQHSSARDVVRLGTHLMDDPEFRATVTRTDARLHDQLFPATNDLLTSYAGADGIKTGHTTEAGWCVLGSATRDGRTVIVAVLGASSDQARHDGAVALLDWAFARQPALN